MKFTKSIRWRLVTWIAIFLSGMLAALDFAACHIYFASRIAQLDESLQRGLTFLNASLYPQGPLPPFFGNGMRGPFNDHFGPPPDPDEDDFFRGPPPDDNPPADQPFNGQTGPHRHQRPDFGTDRRPDSNMGLGPLGLGMLSTNQITTANRRFAGSYEMAGFYYSLWPGQTDTALKQSSNCPAGISRPKVAQKDTGTYARTRNGYREMYHTTEGGNSILVGRALDEEFTARAHFADWLVLGSVAVLAFGVGGAWIIIGRALRPVGKISDAAQRIAAGNLAERINSEETDSELGQLAGVLNSTFARLETAFAQQKQFTADAAHELRTPLAVLISEAQTTLSRERTPADYRESITASLETAQAMRRLTDSLLDLARFDAGQVSLRREKVDLAGLAADSVNLIRPLAAARQLDILCDLAPAEILGDSERLAQVTTNLLTNAIYYNRDGGEIRVTTKPDRQYAVLTVADTGCGIPAVHLPHIFKRFYRANRSRTGNRAGLGLAIAHSIVQAHGGLIQVTSIENVGATFIVRLPIASSVPPGQPLP